MPHLFRLPRHSVTVIALCLVTACSSANGGASSKPTSTTQPLRAPARLEDRKVEAQTELDEWRASAGAIGAILAVRVDGQPDLVLASGLDGRDPDTPMRGDGLFRVGSVTKTFTSAVILGLIGNGKLSFDDTLDRWYPDYPNATAITVEMLLDHTSGTYSDDAQEYQVRVTSDLTHLFTIDEVVAFESSHPPVAEPGARYHYSNTDYTLLGGIAEKITGSSMTALIAHIGAPLGLDNTVLDDGTTLPSGLVHGWFSLNEGAPTLDSAMFPNTAAVSIAGPAGAVRSSARDLLTWAQNLYGGKVLDRRMTAELLGSMPRYVDEPGVSYGYGIQGFCPCVGGKRSKPTFIGHSGNFVGSSTLLVTTPDLAVTLVVQANIGTISQKAQEDLALRVLQLLRTPG